jgi:hypothetical protein
MSKQQAWNLGRTTTFLGLVMWFIQPANLVTMLIAAIGFALLWYAETR